MWFGVHILVGVLSLALVANSAFAQSIDGLGKIKSVVVPTLKNQLIDDAVSQRELLFQRMLERPDDLDVAFAYAALSIQLGDVEAAISTLERMLIYAPGLPRLQLELGLLYYRVRAFHNARSYLEQAIAGPDVPEDVIAKVESLLELITQLEKRQTASGQIRAGFRYQTNANLAPDVSSIDLNGVPFVLSANSREDDDVNAYLAGTAHFSKELETQGDSFDVDILGYATRQVDRDEFDIAQIEITAGPALDMGRFDVDNAALGLYGIASGVFVAGEFYGHAFGTGLRYAAQVRPSSGVLIESEWRRRTYHNSDSAPLADRRDGDEYRAAIAWTENLGASHLLGGGVQAKKTTTDFDYLSYQEVNAWLGPTILFESPLADPKGVWTANMTLGATLREYDGPDAVIDATTEQSDQEYYVRGTLDVPIDLKGWSWSFRTEAEYRMVNSNYDIREHDNLSVSFSIVKEW